MGFAVKQRRGKLAHGEGKMVAWRFISMQKLTGDGDLKVGDERAADGRTC